VRFMFGQTSLACLLILTFLFKITLENGIYNDFFSFVMQYGYKRHRHINKNSSGDDIANVNFYAVRPEATRIR